MMILIRVSGTNRDPALAELLTFTADTRGYLLYTQELRADTTIMITHI